MRKVLHAKSPSKLETGILDKHFGEPFLSLRVDFRSLPPILVGSQMSHYGSFVCSQYAFVTSEALMNNTSQLALEAYWPGHICLYLCGELCPTHILVHLLKS